jgi:hypothetical protein
MMTHDNEKNEIEFKKSIIHEVKKRRFLYDTAQKSYHDAVKCSNAWKDIDNSIRLCFSDFKGKYNNFQFF